MHALRKRGNINMTDHNTIERQQWLDDLQRPDDTPWWWAIGIAMLALLVLMVSSVGPVAFPAG